MIGVLHHTVYGAALEDNPDAKTGPEYSSRNIVRDYTLLFLKQLHWLTDLFLIQCKVLVMTFNILHDLGPTYLKDLSFHMPTTVIRQPSVGDPTTKPTWHQPEPEPLVS